MKINLSSLIMISLISLSAFAAETNKTPSLEYEGMQLTPAADLSQEKPLPHQIIFTNVHFESENQFYPVASDKESAEAMCELLKTGSTLLNFTGASGQISPADVLAYSGDEIVTASEKQQLQSSIS
jgi:hypothetical protein